MRARPASVVGLLIVVAALAVAVATASAGRFQFSGAERGFRLVWPTFNISMSWNNNPRATTCPLTLEGSFHATTMRKVIMTLIGYITRASMPEASCTVGPTEFPVRATLLRETLPWHVRYAAFAGTLPTITSMKLQFTGVSIFIHENSVVEWSCLYRTNAEAPMQYQFVREAGGAITAVNAEPVRQTAPLVGGFLCGESMTYEGNASLTQAGLTNKVTLTLI